MKNWLYIILLTTLISFSGYTQSISSSMIGTASLQSTELTYTTGESRVGLLENSGTVLTDGFNQPDLVISKLDSGLEQFKVSIFPNPTSDYIQIDTEEKNLQFSLTDINGKTVAKFNRQNNKMELRMLPSGTYILTISNNQNRTSKFKIVKQ